MIQFDEHIFQMGWFNHQLDDLVFGAEDPAKKLWIGNIPEEAKWKDLQALVDKAETRKKREDLPNSAKLHHLESQPKKRRDICGKSVFFRWQGSSEWCTKKKQYTPWN